MRDHLHGRHRWPIFLAIAAWITVGCGDDEVDTVPLSDSASARDGADGAALGDTEGEDAAVADSAPSADSALPSDTTPARDSAARDSSTPVDTALIDTAPGPDSSTPGDTSLIDTSLIDTILVDTGPAPETTRVVVVNRPFAASGEMANTWSVWHLSTAGALSDTGDTFEMGRAPWSQVHFTPDGRVGLAVQVDGTVGVFRVEEDLSVTVVHTGYAEGFYADALHIAPDGRSLIVLDGNWPNNGGGVFRLSLASDGTLSAPVKLISSKLAHGLAYLGGAGERVVVAAAAIADSAVGYDVHLLSLVDPVSLLTSETAFSAGDASVSAMALTLDGRFALIAENSMWSGTDHRVAVVEIAGDTLIPRQELTPGSDPTALVISPWDNAALLLAGDGSDAIFHLAYDSSDEVAPFAVLGEVDYQDDGPAPALPASAALISRGSLMGHVLVSENIAIRQLRFEPDGAVTDLGALSMGAGLDHINGAIGVQP